MINTWATCLASAVHRLCSRPRWPDESRKSTSGTVRRSAGPIESEVDPPGETALRVHLRRSQCPHFPHRRWPEAGVRETAEQNDAATRCSRLQTAFERLLALNGRTQQRCPRGVSIVSDSWVNGQRDTARFMVVATSLWPGTRRCSGDQACLQPGGWNPHPHSTGNYAVWSISVSGLDPLIAPNRTT
jgi:hypothetical protein